MNKRLVVWTLVVALPLWCSCKEHVSYADPDVDAARSAFGCAAPKGDAVEACRMLDAFAGAGAMSTWPDTGMHSWWGREYCSDARDDPKTMLFGWLHIMPGEGDAPPFHDVELDKTKTLPHHAEFPMMSVNDQDPAALEGYRRLLTAVAAGTEPDLSGLDDIVRTSAERAWKNVHQLAVANPPKMRLTKSDSGKTVLGNNTVASGDAAGAYVNLRQKDKAVYQLKGGKGAHCISELYQAR